MIARVALLTTFLFFLFTPVADAALIDNINKGFREVYGRTPTQSEWAYWAGRIQRKEKTTYTALVGAMGFQKASQGGSPALSGSTKLSSGAASASGFATSKTFYPSSHNPNFLPDGTLVTAPSTPNVYYIRGGKKSWVLPSILNKWLGENHFFKSNIIMTISDADLARHPSATSVNKIYIGKVLKHPNGAQFYIDDKLRKRPLSASVRTKLRFPGGNLYGVTAAHLSEFKTGPALKGDKHPGGMAIYDGPYHGGRIWKTEEIAGGAIVKRLYLKDRFYEADGYPDESQRAPVDAAMLAKHSRGKNIDRYPDGWVIGIGNNIYVMQNGARRLITSASVLAALGYRDGINIRREYPDIFGKYAQGQPIRAFKNVVAAGASPSKGAATVAPSTATNLTKVRPGIRTLISQVNDHFRFAFGKDPTVAENKFWVDYLYNGEVTTKDSLLAAMRKAKATGKNPARTSRTASLNESTLESKWFSYLFYFVHQKEANEDDKDYWFSRIHSGDRNTIEKLGGTLQWLKDTSGLTHK